MRRSVHIWHSIRSMNIWQYSRLKISLSIRNLILMRKRILSSFYTANFQNLTVNIFYIIYAIYITNRLFEYFVFVDTDYRQIHILKYKIVYHTQYKLDLHLRSYYQLLPTRVNLPIPTLYRLTFSFYLCSLIITSMNFDFHTSLRPNSMSTYLQELNQLGIFPNLYFDKKGS